MRRGFINLNESGCTSTTIQVNGSTYIRIWKCDMGTALYVLDQRKLKGVVVT